MVNRQRQAHRQEELDSKLKEACGVFGIYDLDGEDVASAIYYGLFALQHRGQESCGIVVGDTKAPKASVSVHKGMGLVHEVFTQEILESMHGDIGVAMCAIPRRGPAAGKTPSRWR